MSDECLPRKRLLIVDPSTDNRDVLASALDPARVEILHARGIRSARALLDRQHPHLVVVEEASLSIESLPNGSSGTPPPQPAWIVLGSFRESRPDPAVEVVPKPYHYAPLIRKILALLEDARP
jgi:hypothetical protein